jgi:hypothetical protein
MRSDSVFLLNYSDFTFLAISKKCKIAKKGRVWHTVGRAGCCTLAHFNYSDFPLEIDSLNPLNTLEKSLTMTASFADMSSSFFDL